MEQKKLLIYRKNYWSVWKRFNAPLIDLFIFYAVPTSARIDAFSIDSAIYQSNAAITEKRNFAERNDSYTKGPQK